MATLTAARNVGLDTQSSVEDIVGLVHQKQKSNDAAGRNSMTPDEWFGRLVERLGHNRNEIETAIGDEEIDMIPD